MAAGLDWAELHLRLVESVTDYAIYALDTSGHVMTWNRGAERLKGYRPDEIIGRHFSLFYPPEEIAAGDPESEIEIATREGRFEDEGWRLRKDGSRFWANVILAPLRTNEGELIGFSKVTRDLTLRREAEARDRRLAAEEAAHAEAARRSDELARVNMALAEALLDAETARDAAERSEESMHKAYQDLDQFAYIASHDLKAPLRGIANLAQWIRDDLGDRADAETAEHLRLLRGRVNRMEALIDGILTYSRAGRVRDAVEEVDTGALVRETIELLDPPEGAVIETPPDMPTLRTERVPLQQVFMNLIGNAVKHGGGVGAVVRIEWRAGEGGVEFAVRDNGPGIAPEYQDRIWGIFQTLAARDKVEGTGIGLSVVKKVVEGRGGRATVESAAGRGATFRFTWPELPRKERGGA